MSHREPYMPGAASGDIEKAGDTWALVLVRHLRHPPAKVWKALTDPVQLREWAPFDSDRDLGTAGATAKLTTVGTPTPYASETRVKRADAEKALEYSWGGGEIRWELEPHDGGTRLKLWHNIDRRYIAMGAAGWHVCLDVLDRALAGQPIGRMAGPEVMKFEGWQRLHAEYAKRFGVEAQGGR